MAGNSEWPLDAAELAMVHPALGGGPALARGPPHSLAAGSLASFGSLASMLPNPGALPLGGGGGGGGAAVSLASLGLLTGMPGAVLGGTAPTSLAGSGSLQLAMDPVPVMPMVSLAMTSFADAAAAVATQFEAADSAAAAAAMSPPSRPRSAPSEPVLLRRSGRPQRRAAPTRFAPDPDEHGDSDTDARRQRRASSSSAARARASPRRPRSWARSRDDDDDDDDDDDYDDMEEMDLSGHHDAIAPRKRKRNVSAELDAEVAELKLPEFADMTKEEQVTFRQLKQQVAELENASTGLRNLPNSERKKVFMFIFV